MQSNVTVEEARELLLGQVAPLAGKPVSLIESLGRIVAEDINAPGDLPPDPRSAFDGYAIHRDDLASGAVFRIRESLGSGEMPREPLSPGQAVGVLTGGPLPANTGAIVQVEKTEARGDSLLVRAELKEGQNIRQPGEDFQSGELLAPRGSGVGPGLIGALSAYGIYTVPVFPRPRVGVISLGSEVTPGGAPVAPGQVRDCNGPLLASLATGDGGRVTAVETVCGQGYGEIRDSLTRLLERSDLVLTIGGTASGACDQALKFFGDIGRLSFWGVRIKPGSHSGAAFYKGRPVIALSGNTAACAVGYHLLAAPVIRAMQGIEPWPQPIAARCVDSFPRKGGPRRFMRGYAFCGPEGWQVTLLPGQKSSMIRSLVGYNALVDLPAGHPPVDPGSRVRVLPVTPGLVQQACNYLAEGGQGDVCQR